MSTLARLLPYPLALFLLAATAEAVVVQSKSLDELVAEAPVVVIGTVMGIQYLQLADRDRPHTEITLLLQEVVAGADKIDRRQGEKLALLFAGGLSEKGVFDIFVGMPQLQLGETYLLLLRGEGWTLNPIAGWHQGAFRLIGIDDQGGKLVLSLADAVLVGIGDAQLEFASPDLAKIRQIVEPPPQPGQEKGGIQLDDPAKSPKQPDRPGPTAYLEGNDDEIAAQDAKRAEESQAEAREWSRADFLALALGDVRPLLLDELRAEILKRHKLFENQLRKMKFSLVPAPVALTQEGDQPAPLPDRKPR